MKVASVRVVFLSSCLGSGVVDRVVEYYRHMIGAVCFCGCIVLVFIYNQVLD